MNARAEIQALLERLARGDRSALEPAFELLWPIVRRFSARALRNDADAEDVAQRALCRVFEQVASFDRAKSGLGWVLAITSFECRTLLRSRQRRREQQLERSNPYEPWLVTSETPEAIALERELLRAAREALDSLPPREASVILAALGGVRPTGATFRKRLERALAKLRRLRRLREPGGALGQVLPLVCVLAACPLCGAAAGSGQLLLALATLSALAAWLVFRSRASARTALSPE